MRHDNSIEPLKNRVLTRREMIAMLASLSAGALASPQTSRAGQGSTENVSPMLAKIFFESNSTIALRRALRYAGDDGFVASMSQLLYARVNATYDNIIWNTWFTSYSDESVVTTPGGNHVVVTVQGGGVLASPQRWERSLRADLHRSNAQGLTGQYAAKISEDESRGLLNGKLPDGSEIPVFQFTEFKRGIADLPMRYAVTLDFETAKKSTSGYQSFDRWKDDPNMIIRAGGVETLSRYLDRARARHDTTLMGNWHAFNRIDPTQPQSRLLVLSGNQGGVGSEGKDLGLGWGYDSDSGMSAAGVVDMARYVAIAPRHVSTSLRYLDFKA